MMILILLLGVALASADTGFDANFNVYLQPTYDFGRYEILKAEMSDNLKNLVLGNSKRCYIEQWDNFCPCLKSGLEIVQGGTWNCFASRARNLHYAASYRKNNFIHFVRGSLEILLFRSGGGIFS